MKNLTLLGVCDRITVSNLNRKIDAMQTEAVLLREELAMANSNLSQQQHENTALRTENSALLDGHRRQMQVDLYFCCYVIRYRISNSEKNISVTQNIWLSHDVCFVT